ncbi:MAG: hypothetical protein JXA46_00955 [Dehalococcoidales bacterium]|nr:hypothetical protein [Dehalococcoidales bacterium]
MNQNQPGVNYEVLSPWAEADPIPLVGISPRPKNLEGKKIGLFYNVKRASHPMLTVVERKLKERFPTCECIWYANQLPPGKAVSELEGADKTAFEDWARGVDAVVGAVGD